MWCCRIIIVLFCMFEIYKSEEAECVKEHEKEAIKCLNDSQISRESEKLQNTLFVDFNSEQHEHFCHHWTSTVLECLEEKIHGCHELERGFHGTIEAYNYICKEEGKKEYEKITWCTTDVTFQRRSRECVRQFNAAVAGLDRRYGSIERYQIVTSPPAAVTDNWEESCSRTYEFMHCQESVIAYCGTAMKKYFEGDDDKIAKKEKDLAKDAKNFQHHFMSHMFAEHQSMLECTRLSKLAIILIIFACVIVFVTFVCLIPFCCCRPKRTGMVEIPSYPYGMDNMAFRSDSKEKGMKGP